MKIDFVELLKSFGVKALAGLSGWKAWLANFILNKVLKELKEIWQKVMNRLENSQAGKDLTKEYLDKINKPDATADDVEDAARRLLDGKP